MKMNQLKYEEIKAGIAAIVDFHGKNHILERYTNRPTAHLMWALFDALWFDKQYRDDHPSYVKGRPRVIPHTNDTWLNDLYRSGLNDSHINTALFKISRELNLTPTNGV